MTTNQPTDAKLRREWRAATDGLSQHDPTADQLGYDDYRLPVIQIGVGKQHGYPDRCMYDPYDAEAWVQADPYSIRILPNPDPDPTDADTDPQGYSP